MKTSNSNVYVYIAFRDKQINHDFILFAENCRYSVLTDEVEVLNYCIKKKIHAICLPVKPSKFKSTLKKIDISFLILAGDNGGSANYLARRYPSAFVQGLQFNTMEFWEKRILWKQNLFYLWLYRLLGLTGKYFEKHLIVYEESIRGIYYALVDKIVWGLNNEHFRHGHHSNLLFLQGEWEKKDFINHGIDEKNIRVTGSIVADSLINDLKNGFKKTPELYEPCDLLFFSQPLYKYSGEPYYLEELEIVVNKCYQMGIKMCIKLHPRDDINVFIPFTKGKCRLIKHRNDWVVEESILLIQNSKVVMGKGSTSLMLPLLMQKPVMCLDLYDSDIVHFKYHFDLKMLLKDIENFEYLYNLATDPKKQPFILDQQNQFLSGHGYYDGLSWKRIRKEIDRYLNNSEMAVYKKKL